MFRRRELCNLNNPIEGELCIQIAANSFGWKEENMRICDKCKKQGKDIKEYAPYQISPSIDLCDKDRVEAQQLLMEVEKVIAEIRKEKCQEAIKLWLEKPLAPSV
jgi:hypothetical protein